MSSKGARKVFLTILDYDDTILPTTYLHKTHRAEDITAGKLSDNLNQELLSVLQDNLVQLLEECIALGDVLIISNAQLQWIQLTCPYVMPRVATCIRQNGIKIVSAYPEGVNESEDCENWKTPVFRTEVAALKQRVNAQNSQLNLLSIGDGASEQFATMDLSQSQAKVWYIPEDNIRFVVFKKEPTLEELVGQVNALRRRIPRIIRMLGPVNHGIEDLDRRLSLIEQSVAKHSKTLTARK